MKIASVAFEGSLNKLYEEIEELEKEQNESIDLILICGNFQAVRNKNDLKCVDCVECWKHTGDFKEYYSGKRKAKRLTLVIGGNQEASNYFRTLPYGGWLANNIYYMGNSNVVKVNGVRIGGISGISDNYYDHIYKTQIAKSGYFERLPFDQKDRRSVCYTRYLDVYRMLQLKGDLDIMFTFDWPLGVLNDKQSVMDCLKKVPFLFQNEFFNDLGSAMFKKVLDHCRPSYWFASKVRVSLNKMYKHHSVAGQSNRETSFHALNKFVRKRKRLEIIELKCDNKNGLEYDLEWLAILKATNQYVSIEREPTNPPPEYDQIPVSLDDEQFIREALKDNFKISTKNFSRCAPVTVFGLDQDPERINNYVNKQTTKFCKLLQLTDPNQLIVNQTGNNLKERKGKKYLDRVTHWVTSLFCRYSK